MSDPRNAAHDKEVAQEKKHHGAESSADGAPPGQAGKKARKKKPHSVENTAPPQSAPVNETPPAQNTGTDPPPELEGSLVVLAQLKDLAFHANAHQERLAELMLTVEEKLKQKELAISVGEVYSAQAELHTRLTALIEAYAAECTRLQGEGE